MPSEQPFSSDASKQASDLVLADPNTSPISKLPFEVLGNIFLYDKSGRYTYIQVSRYWCDVATRTKNLWTSIDMNHVILAKQAITLSSPLPISVCASDTPTTLSTRSECQPIPSTCRVDFYAVFQAVLELARVRELVLEDYMFRRILSHLIIRSAPKLELLDIQIRNEPWAIREPVTIEHDLFAGEVPLLRHLSLSFCTVKDPLSSPLLTAPLTSLILTSVAAWNDFSEMVDTLKGLPALENLKLVNSVPPPPDSIHVHLICRCFQHPEPALTFLGLASLHVDDEASHVCGFMRSIHIPTTCSTHLVLQEVGQDSTSFRVFIAPILSSLLSTASDAGQAFDTVIISDTVKLKPHDQRRYFDPPLQTRLVSLREHEKDAPLLPARLEITVCHTEDSEGCLLRSLLRNLPPAIKNARYLLVSHEDLAECDRWRSLLNFPSVVEVSVPGKALGKSLLQALKEPHPSFLSRAQKEKAIFASGDLDDEAMARQISTLPNLEIFIPSLVTVLFQRIRVDDGGSDDDDDDDDDQGEPGICMSDLSATLDSRCKDKLAFNLHFKRCNVPQALIQALRRQHGERTVGWDGIENDVYV